ncbi:MAG TPA: metal-dependent transcriptional regulator [Candidatus Solibacter sp.]|jgi:DtxR family Mn-dependent transcriptional regulator|nr:metal-dependent transcriptional regulator [Candidatus Solibacter sp.]
MITISKEDYLKAIAGAEAEGEAAIPAALAQSLRVTRPAVTAAIKRLAKDNLVRVTKDGSIRLTDQGREIAQRTIFRHHLIERMLTEIFDMPWYAVHDEAERLEHAVSPAFEKKLVEKLGPSETCPHGNSFNMLSNAERRKRGLCLLNEAQAKKKYCISAIYERDRKLLEFLDQQGIRPGTHISIQSQNYDSTVTLLIADRPVRLGLTAAKRIWVAGA